MMSFITSDNKHGGLWEIIEHGRFLTKDQFKEATQVARKENRHITDVLFEQHSPSQDKLLLAFSKYYNTPAIILRKRVIVPYVLNLIPKEVAEQHSVIVFKKSRNVVHVATINPENSQTMDFIRKKTGHETKVYITSPEDIKHALHKYKSEIRTEFARIIQDSINQTLAINDTAEKIAQYVPIIKMVDTIIERALSQHASDIHFEPTAKKIIIRYRIDGLLNRIVELPIEILPPLVTRIKIMANLKIDEHRLPQDGRFKFAFNEREVAIRVSAIPTLHGSKIVMRLLDKKENQFTLAKLGLNQKDLQTVKNEIAKPHGMILATGPTGSGKTTTLYTLLTMLNKEDVNICTIEDPIEYGIEGINQTQVNPAAGLTFANGLRSLLRQDPNILMVGEIRDNETADIAVNSAMTGHLVLSTLHTNDSFLAIQRLTEMGVQPFLVASVTNLIIGQRLVRKICPSCKTRAASTQKELEHYGTFFDLDAIHSKLKKHRLMAQPSPKDTSQLSFYYGRGCAKCNNTGYLGRIGIYEVLQIDRELQKFIVTNPSAEAIKKHAEKLGVLTMIEDGILKVFNGETTFSEILRVTKE